MINGLDLFSGYGGISIALSEYVRPIAYCEIEKFAQKVLLSRMADGKLPIAPIWDDVSTLKGKDIPGKVDIIYGGFPCQDISVAGLGKGLAGERSGLFGEICRLSQEIRPEWIFLENVPNIRTKGLLAIVRSLAELGYDSRWTVISAKSIGAPHLRKRWFLLARDAQGRKWDAFREFQDRQDANAGRIRKNVSHAYHSRRLKQRRPFTTPEEFKAIKCGSWWEVEPSMGRMVNGCTDRVDRIKALGNGVVPLQATRAFQILMGINS